MNTSNVNVFVRIFEFTFLVTQSWQNLQKNESLINIAQCIHEGEDVSNEWELCPDHLSIKWLALLGFFVILFYIYWYFRKAMMTANSVSATTCDQN